MYMEMSQGSYGYPEDRLNRSKTILPMNINPYIWGSLVNEGKPFPVPETVFGHGGGYVRDEGRKAFDDPRTNIRAAAVLLKRIQGHLQNPTIRNIATLYNSLSQERVTNYGAQVEQIYRNQEWQ